MHEKENCYQSRGFYRKNWVHFQQVRRNAQQQTADQGESSRCDCSRKQSKWNPASERQSIQKKAEENKSGEGYNSCGGGSGWLSIITHSCRWGRGKWKCMDEVSVGRMGCRSETCGKRQKTAAEEIVGRKRVEAYDSLEEALAVNAEIKEAKGRSVDDTRADWKRKAHPLNILQKTQQHAQE